TVVVKNIKTVEYRFQPVGEESFFFGYQFVVKFLNAEGFTIEQSFPIEDLSTVIVDFDLNDLLRDSVVRLRVNTAQGERAMIRTTGSPAAFKAEVIDVAIPALANMSVDVKVDTLEHPANPAVHASYPIKGKV